MAKQGPIKPNDVLTPEEIEAMRNFSADPRNHSMATNPPLGPLSSGTAPPAFPPANLNQARPAVQPTTAAASHFMNLMNRQDPHHPTTNIPMGTSTSGMFNPVANPQIPIAASQVNGANSFQFAEDAKNLSVTTKDNTKATKELTQAIKDNTEISKQSVMPAGGTTTAGTSNIATQQLGVTSTPLPTNFNQTGQATASQLSQQTVQQFHQQQNNLNQQVAQQVQNRASGAYGTSTSSSAGGGNFFGAYSSASSTPVGGGSGGGFSPGAGTANMPRGGAGGAANPNQPGRTTGAPSPSQGTTTAQYFSNFRMGMAYNNAAAQAVANGQPPPPPPSGMGGVLASSQPSGGGGGGAYGSGTYNSANQNAIGRGIAAGSSDIAGGISQINLAGYSAQGAFARTAANPVAYSGYGKMQESLSYGTTTGAGTGLIGIGAMVMPFNPLVGGAIMGLGAVTAATGGYNASVASTESAEIQQKTAYQFNRQLGYGPAFSRKTSVLDAASNIPYYGPMYQRELSTMLARGNYASLESLMPTIERNLTGGTGNQTFVNRADLMRAQVDQLTFQGYSVEQAYSSLAQTAAAVTRRSASTASDELLSDMTYGGLVSAGFTGQQIGSLINLNQRNAYGFGSTLSTDAQGVSSGLGSRIARIGQAKEMTAVGTMGLAESVMGVGLSLANAGLTGDANQMFQSAQGFENTGFTGYQGLRAYEAYTRMKHGFAGAGQEGLASVYGSVGRSLLYAESLSETGDPLKAAQRIQRAAPQTNFARLRKLIGDDNIALQIAAASGFASADEVEYAGMAGMSAPPEAALPSPAFTGRVSVAKSTADRLRQKNLYEETEGVPALQEAIAKMIKGDFTFEQQTLTKSKLTTPQGMETLIGTIGALEKAINNGFDKIKTVIEKFEKEVGNTKAGMDDISGTLTKIHDQLK
jgi:hypothetical protein